MNINARLTPQGRTLTTNRILNESWRVADAIARQLAVPPSTVGAVPEF